MTKNIKTLVSLLIGSAVGLLIYSKIKRDYLLKPAQQQTGTQSKTLQAKKLILKYKKPARVEVETFTQKFKADIEDIKKMKIPMDNASPFYMQLQLFSDDSDDNAPLVLQVKLKDIKNNGLIKEDSANLE